MGTVPEVAGDSGIDMSAENESFVGLDPNTCLFITRPLFFKSQVLLTTTKLPASTSTEDNIGFNCLTVCRFCHLKIVPQPALGSSFLKLSPLHLPLCFRPMPIWGLESHLEAAALNFLRRKLS